MTLCPCTCFAKSIDKTRRQSRNIHQSSVVHVYDSDKKPPSYHRGDSFETYQSGARVTEKRNEQHVLDSSSPASDILAQPTLVIRRRLELMNVMLSFEQANNYDIFDTSGNMLGYMSEDDPGIMRALTRNVLRLHRPFIIRVFDNSNVHVLTFRRKFTPINSKVTIYTPPDETGKERVIGQVQQHFNIIRRKYDLFLADKSQYSDEDVYYTQFAKIDEPFMSFSFAALNENKQMLGLVNRNWVGLFRELFTDTGVYILQMDSSNIENASRGAKKVWGGSDMQDKDVLPPPTSLEERAVLLATAVCIDFDYFSIHSRYYGGGGGGP